MVSMGFDVTIERLRAAGIGIIIHDTDVCSGSLFNFNIMLT